MTLQSWYEKGTDMAVEFGVGFWFGGGCLIYAWIITHVGAAR
jgi:hypothetical protein